MDVYPLKGEKSDYIKELEEILVRHSDLIEIQDRAIDLLEEILVRRSDLIEIQDRAIDLLEQSLVNYKAAWKSEREISDRFREILGMPCGCSGFEPKKEKSERELISAYGII